MFKQDSSCSLNECSIQSFFSPILLRYFWCARLSNYPILPSCLTTIQVYLATRPKCLSDFLVIVQFAKSASPYTIALKASCTERFMTPSIRPCLLWPNLSRQSLLLYRYLTTFLATSTGCPEGLRAARPRGRGFLGRPPDVAPRRHYSGSCPAA
jgi:hypothetical protein